MPQSAKLGRAVRSLALPLSLSLLLHAAIFLALWTWPMRSSAPMLSIETARFALDTCVLESTAPTLLSQDELPADLRTPDSSIDLTPKIVIPQSPSQGSRVSTPSAIPETNATLGAPRQARSPGNGAEGRGLFPVAAKASSVVFVLDHSVSMGMERKLDFARRELIAGLHRLSPAQRFQVIAYNDSAQSLAIQNRVDLLPAEPSVIARVEVALGQLKAGGKTNHLVALRSALALRPAVLYFLTDADDLKEEDVELVTRCNRGTVVNTIELTHRSAHLDGALARLARDNRGSYQRVSP